MVKYAHRKNEFNDPKKYQALEIDLKAKVSWDCNRLVLGHNWDQINCSFWEFINECNSDTKLAINIKTAGLAKFLHETAYKSILDKLANYFFFDMAIPDQIEFQKYFPNNTACRWSEFENQHNTGKTDWIWFDYFDAEKNEAEFWYELLQATATGAKVVVVDPLMHGTNLYIDLNELDRYGAYGICTDNV